MVVSLSSLKSLLLLLLLLLLSLSCHRSGYRQAVAVRGAVCSSKACSSVKPVCLCDGATMMLVPQGAVAHRGHVHDGSA